MNEYESTLTFYLTGVGAEPDECVELLGEHGCDDAIVGTGRAGRVALTFNHISPSAREAVFSAIRDVKSALPDAALIEATPDFVGQTEVADFVGRTRQNMRKLLLSRRAPAPPPVHEGTSPLWHLAVVLA